MTSMAVLRRMGTRIGPLKNLYRRGRRRWRHRELRRFHDTLEATAMAGRWWLWAGALLGLVRDGDLLLWDNDIDFAVVREDVERLQLALPALRDAGYQVLRRYDDPEGRLAGLHLRRHGVIFDFFTFDDVGDGWYEFQQFGTLEGRHVRQVCRVPKQRLSTRPAWGRSWPCATDVEAELDALYGAWRTPDASWSYLSAPCICETVSWKPRPGLET